MANSKSYMLLCIGLSVILCSQVLAYYEPVPPIYDGALFYDKDIVSEKIPIIDGPEFKNDQYSIDSPKLDAAIDFGHFNPLQHDHPSDVAPYFDNIQFSKDSTTTDEASDSTDISKIDAATDFNHNSPYHYEMPSDRTPYFNNIQDSNDSPTTDETPDSTDTLKIDAATDFNHNSPIQYETPSDRTPYFNSIQYSKDSPTTTAEAPDSTDTLKIDSTLNNPIIFDYTDPPGQDDDGPLIEAETVTEKKNDITTSESEKGEANKEANWIYLHAKYPWVKKNVPKSTTGGTRKLLLNDADNN